MYTQTLSVAVSEEDMANIEAVVRGIRCAGCGGTSWDPPERSIVNANEVLFGEEGRLEKRAPTVVLSIHCSMCGKQESFDYFRLAAYSKTARRNLGQRLSRSIQWVKSMIAELNPASGTITPGRDPRRVNI